MKKKGNKPDQENYNKAKQILHKNHIDSEIKKVFDVLENNSELKNEVPKVAIPQYTIERVDRLYGVFKQGKVYVTIEENISIDSQKILCERLTNRFTEFSNIVICLYANNPVGKILAKGNDKTISVEEQKRYWLAMYTYNPVEGEYFDDNPTGYLGIH